MKVIISRFCELFSSLKSNFYLVNFLTKQKNGKKYIVLRTILSVFDAVISVITTVIPGLLMNELIYNRSIQTIVLLTIALISLPVIRQISINNFNLIFNRISNDIQTQTNMEFFRHLSQLDIEFCEKPENKTHEDIALETLSNATESVDLIFALVSGVIQLLSIAAVVSILHTLTGKVSKRFGSE